MPSDQLASPARRNALIRAAGLVALGAATAVAPSARASGATPKADVKYQFTPKGDQRCGLCASFIAPTGGGAGQCKIVEGPIPKDGWCVLFSPAR